MRFREQNRITISRYSILAMALSISLAELVNVQYDHPLYSLTKQCNEDIIQLHLDPSPFQDLVESDFKQFIEEKRSDAHT